MTTPQGLALHTTTGELGICLVNHQGSFRQQSWDLGRQLANEIQIKLAEFIQPQSWQDLDFIAVANGPGSYTSTRIGVVTAKTLAQQLQVPVYGISTLIAIAWYHHDKLQPEQYIAVEIQSHNENVFGAIYQFITPQQPLKVITTEAKFTPLQWQETIEQKKSCSGKLIKIQAPEKIAFSTQSLLEIALLKQKQTSLEDEYHWQYLTVFYE